MAARVSVTSASWLLIHARLESRNPYSGGGEERRDQDAMQEAACLVGVEELGVDVDASHMGASRTMSPQCNLGAGYLLPNSWKQCFTHGNTVRPEISGPRVIPSVLRTKLRRNWQKLQVFFNTLADAS